MSDIALATDRVPENRRLGEAELDAADPTKQVASGHGKYLGKLRMDRGPLRWWLMVMGLVTVQYSGWRFTVGVGLVIAGAMLHVISKAYLRPGRKFLNRTRSITTRGPYRFTRNPFYLANLFAEVGLLIIIGQLWIAVVYLPVWAWVYCKTILDEERKLLDLCGEVYVQYCRRVPRLIPRPWRFLHREELAGPRFSWANPHIAEGREMQRALRLVSYPCLLRAVAAAMIHPDWTATVSDPAVHGCVLAFLALNAIGWLTTIIFRKLDRSGTDDCADRTDFPTSVGV